MALEHALVSLRDCTATLHQVLHRHRPCVEIGMHTGTDEMAAVVTEGPKGVEKASRQEVEGDLDVSGLVSRLRSQLSVVDSAVLTLEKYGGDFRCAVV